MAMKSLSVRIDSVTLDKLHVISDYEAFCKQPDFDFNPAVHRRLEARHGEISLEALVSAAP